ncbi:lipopolysaccharide biosynthesis protein [Okibacterium endophyticum]
MANGQGDAAHESKALAQSGALSFVGAAASAILGFALTVVLTRSFGESGAGVVMQAIAVFTITLSLAKLGMDSVAVWLLPRLAHSDPALIRGALAQIIGFSLAGGLIGGAVIVIGGQHIGHDRAVGDAVSAAGWFLPAAAVLMAALAATRGLGGIGAYVAIGSIGLPLIRIAVVAGIAVLGGTLTSAALGWAAPTAIMALAALLVVWILLRGHEAAAGTAGPFRSDRELFTRVRRYAVPRTISAGLEQSILWLDVLIVGWILGSAAAGVYGGASRFVAAGLIVDTALRVVVSPRFSTLLHQGRIADVEKLYQTAARWLVIFSTPIYLMLAIFAPVVLSWLGPGFDAGAVALAVLSAGAIVTFAAGNIHSVLLMSGRSGWAAFNKGVVLVINVVGNVALIPVIGITGAAVSWAISMLADAALATVQVRRFVGIRTDLRGIGYALLVPVVSIGVPAIALRLWLGATGAALAISIGIGAVLFVVWCVLDRRRLHLVDLISLVRRRGTTT